jgi:hypothetical protein
MGWSAEEEEEEEMHYYQEYEYLELLLPCQGKEDVSYTFMSNLCRAQGAYSFTSTSLYAFAAW